VLVDGQNGRATSRCELALNRRLWCEELELRCITQSGGSLTDNAVERVHAVGVEVITRIDALTGVNTPLVRALINTRLERVEDTVTTPGSNRTEVAIKR
jgi:hypothetical protein